MNVISGGVIYAIISIPIGIIIGYFIRKYIAEAKIQSAEEEAKKFVKQQPEKPSQSKEK